MKNKFFFILSIVILASCSTFRTLKTATSLQKGNVQKGSFIQSDSFIFKNNLVFVKVVISGKKYVFLVDTGAPPTALSTAVIKEAGLKVKSKGKIGDSQSNDATIDLITLDTINIAGVDFYNAPCIGADLDHLSKVLCLKIDGIVGSSIMRKAAWKFNFENQMVTIASDADLLEPLPNPETIHFATGRFDKTPMLDLVYKEKKYDGFVSFDMGSNGKVSFGKNLLKKIGDDIKPEHYSIGNSSVGIFGHGRIDTTFYATNQNLNIGSVRLDSQLVSLRNRGVTLLGMGIITNHNFIIDWKKKEIIFSRIKVAEATMLNPAGFSTVFKNNDCLVTEIYGNSNAKEAGLLLNDTINFINGIKVFNLSDDEQCAIRTKNISKADTFILQIKRNDAPVTIQFSGGYVNTSN